MKDSQENLFFKLHPLKDYIKQLSKGIVHLTEEYVKDKGNQLFPILPELQGPEIDLYYIFPQRFKKSKSVMTLYEFLLTKFNSTE
ncbi:hypothetical protein IM40_03880 [Candidatus Paracaedimonas acanthamoebae]|nr:hypothetical protein IM40_03880 [Candidatus Paracaedimonas acanthamoebae]